MAKRRTGKRVGSMPVGIGSGIAAAIGITVAGGLVLSALIASERMGEGGANALCRAVQMLAALSGCAVAQAVTKQKRLLSVGCTAAGYWAVLLIASLTLGGDVRAMGAVSAVIALGGAMTQIPILFANRSGAARHRKRAYR